jgi:hypothetical protein
MSDLDTRLEDILNADAPAMRDPMFRIQVMLRRERRAFRRQLLAAAGMTLVVAILAALGSAAVGALMSPGPKRLALVALTAVVLTFGLAWAGLRRLGVLRPMQGSLLTQTGSVLRPLLWH